MAPPTLEFTPGTADARAIEAMQDVVSVHVHTAHWWNNASFALPLLGTIVSLAIGALARNAEALGFGAFLAFVTLAMLPVVLLTWRRTATAVVVRREGVTALHAGRVLRELPWSTLARIERADYDSIRWRLRPTEGDHLSIEAELTDIEGLIEHASRLSGLAPPD